MTILTKFLLKEVYLLLLSINIDGITTNVQKAPTVISPLSESFIGLQPVNST
jgi:hypothetical protein